jgi:cytochrome c553
MRTCKECSFTGEKEEFPTAGVKNGKQYYRHRCKSCHSKKGKERIQEKKSKVDKIKSNRGCKRCGFDNPAALDFHHTDQNKSETISRMVRNGRSWATIESEIEKCEVLCANCHRIEHYE